MTRFNPPPGWPVPPGWSPTPDWQPDPQWPPAPPGWQFWVDTPADAEKRTTPTSMPSGSHRWLVPVIVSLALCATVALVVVVVAVLPHRRDAGTVSPPTGSAQPTFMPDWPAPKSLRVDFRTWTAFGGIDTQFGDDGRSVVLDTHDTTDTWRTKWSGLAQPGPARCDLRMTGRVRDISHSDGVAGGFGIGLATLTPGDPATAALDGTAIQFDFGQQGFRTADYPGDTDHGLQPGRLDHDWHNVEIAIDANAHTLSIDGLQVSSVATGARCGNPVIRVWAGAAEFADFSFVVD
ncbi:hypothetical protein BTO20_06370 [Mycobacterium dioxanotrophicus]|uniref:3-keto-disaccharide hydrolase domain-containing protein n=1 Tax=Mycobacterium dioxanotrophicus TaxID=482462 RepID=A0A1Y0BZB7_9MYCO|nr:hypothetical protein [Mycobacterium dioxanotrophicus]ART68258.1 hypothetical protein BTO20_06370 [Mycobacterium dioxanotrophicus]